MGLALAFAPLARGAVMARWDFEVFNTPPDSTGATSGPYAAVEGTGQASGVHALATTMWSSPVGNGSAESFSSNMWSTGDYYQFASSTTGFTGITLLFDQARSGTGPTDFKVQYSIDGNNFVDAPGAAYLLSGVSFNSTTVQTTTPPRFGFDFSSITELNNQPSLTLRLVQTSATGAPAGTSRVDNVVIGTDPVPEPGVLAVMAAGLAGVMLGRRRRCGGDASRC